MKQKPKTKKPKTAWRTWHYYWQEIKKYKWYTLLMLILTPIVVFIRAVLAPLLFAVLIDKVSQGASAEELWRTAAFEIIGFLSLYALSKAVLEPIRFWAGWKMELLAMYDFAELCFDTIVAQSMQFHNDRFSGSLVSQANKFIWSFDRFIDTIVWSLYGTVSYIIMIFIVLAREASWYAVGLFVFIIIYAIASFYSFRKLAPLNEAEAEAETKQTGQLADTISNMISVKSYAHEDHERRRYLHYARNTYDVSCKYMRLSIGRELKFGGVQVGITALILAFLVYGQGWFGISVATLILIVNYTQAIQGELWSFNNIFKNINRSFGDAHEMTLILDMKDDVVDLPGARRLSIARSEIDFDHISFQHQDAKEAIFEDFSLTIQPGERVGLVGVSGSGKTTLTKLLLRFADVDAGEITISGQNIKDVTQDSLREQIAYVPQETSLFHRTIAENIGYGKPSAKLKDIQHAAKLANADEFIKDLPDGYKTLVGERGIKLSGGQRQRIAIARAILKDAPILVLDEATSALDSESEALIQDALIRLMKNRTSIVIAHRLSTIASLDRIVVLDNGKIVEQGTHAELLKKGGVYSRLWNRQSGAFMKD